MTELKYRKWYIIKNSVDLSKTFEVYLKKKNNYDFKVIKKLLII